MGFTNFVGNRPVEELPAEAKQKPSDERVAQSKDLARPGEQNTIRSVGNSDPKEFDVSLSNYAKGKPAPQSEPTN